MRQRVLRAGLADRQPERCSLGLGDEETAEPVVAQGVPVGGGLDSHVTRTCAEPEVEQVRPRLLNLSVGPLTRLADSEDPVLGEAGAIVVAQTDEFQ